MAYIGGKNRLAARIISILPEHVAYVEPFAGGAQVLFHKPPSEVEVLNDLDFDIVNFFRVCQWHYEELIRYLRYSLASRRLHELHVKTNPAVLTDIQRAGRFFYLQKTLSADRLNDSAKCSDREGRERFKSAGDSHFDKHDSE